MNNIDILSKEKTTQEVLRHYKKQGFTGMLRLATDLQKCSKGNRLALEALLGHETKQYERDTPERVVDENADIANELREG